MEPWRYLDDHIKKNQVRKTSVDRNLIDSLINTAETDLLFLKGLKIDKISARKIMSNYYDILRSILEAIALTKGYKIYSHEAFKAFLKDLGEHDLAENFDRFRKIRNKINYYGLSLMIEDVKKNSTKMIKMIDTLKQRYLNL